jgi:hypothetical protein
MCRIASVFPLGWEPGAGVRRRREWYSPDTGAGSSLTAVTKPGDKERQQRQPREASSDGAGEGARRGMRAAGSHGRSEAVMLLRDSRG